MYMNVKTWPALYKLTRQTIYTQLNKSRYKNEHNTDLSRYVLFTHFHIGWTMTIAKGLYVYLVNWKGFWMEQTVRLNILILEASIVSDLFVVFVKFWLRFVKRLFDGISCYPAEAASAAAEVRF